MKPEPMGFSELHLSANTVSPEPEPRPEPALRVEDVAIEGENEVLIDNAIAEAYEQDEFARSIIIKLREGARTLKGFPLMECREEEGQIRY